MAHELSLKLANRVVIYYTGKSDWDANVCSFSSVQAKNGGIPAIQVEYGGATEIDLTDYFETTETSCDIEFFCHYEVTNGDTNWCY